MRAEGWKGDWVAQSSPMRSEWSEEAETTVQGRNELSASFQEKVEKIRRGGSKLTDKILSRRKSHVVHRSLVSL